MRIFAVTQIAASFLLLAGASMLLKTLIVLPSAQTGLDTDHVLALNVPVMTYGKTPDRTAGFYRETARRMSELSGVDKVAIGTVVPWRDAGSCGPGLQFTAEGYVKVQEQKINERSCAPFRQDFLRPSGLAIIAGRDFNESDRKDPEPVVIVSHSVAQRMFPNQDAVNRAVAVRLSPLRATHVERTHAGWRGNCRRDHQWVCAGETSGAAISRVSKCRARCQWFCLPLVADVIA